MGSLVRGALSRAIFTFERAAEAGCWGASGQSAAGGGRGRHGECFPQEPAGFRFPSLCRVQAVWLREACAGLSSQPVSLGLDVAEPPRSLTLQGHLSSAVPFSWSRLGHLLCLVSHCLASDSPGCWSSLRCGVSLGSDISWPPHYQQGSYCIGLCGECSEREHVLCFNDVSAPHGSGGTYSIFITL